MSWRGHITPYVPGARVKSLITPKGGLRPSDSPTPSLAGNPQAGSLARSARRGGLPFRRPYTRPRSTAVLLGGDSLVTAGVCLRGCSHNVSDWAVRVTHASAGHTQCEDWLRALLPARPTTRTEHADHTQDGSKHNHFGGKGWRRWERNQVLPNNVPHARVQDCERQDQG